ncbi:MAG: hypothetical protein GY856_24635, partial [bacterium]|nr:hypothetical protein [bacterium]
MTGRVPLSPIQRWLLDRNPAALHHFNQALLLELREALDPPRLAMALGALLEHHDALRLRLFRQGSEWRQINAGIDGQVPLLQVDLAALTEGGQRAALEQVAAEVQGSLNLSRGPLMRMALIELGPGRSRRLLWVVHHLAVDGVSWRVLLEDLERVYRQLERGTKVSLPPKTTSFKSWSERLHEYARSEAPAVQLELWLAAGREPVARLPQDLAGGLNTVASVRTVTVALQAEETRALLQEVPRAYRTQINDVLLAALAPALAEHLGERAIRIDLEGHGREEVFEGFFTGRSWTQTPTGTGFRAVVRSRSGERGFFAGRSWTQTLSGSGSGAVARSESIERGLDLSRTVGWFTSLFPVVLELDEARDPASVLKSVKEQLRTYPAAGLGYGVLRYLSEQEEAASLRSQPAAEVLFNYLGQLDGALSASSLFRPAAESSGPAVAPEGLRSHLLEINGGVSNGCLRMTWAYSENLHRRATIESLAAGFLEALRGLIRHCLSPGAGGLTPSDFPEAGLDQARIDQLLAELGGVPEAVYP